MMRIILNCSKDAGRIKPDLRGLDTRWTWKKKSISKEYKLKGQIDKEDIKKDWEYTQVPIQGEDNTVCSVPEMKFRNELDIRKINKKLTFSFKKKEKILLVKIIGLVELIQSVDFEEDILKIFLKL